MAFAYCRQCQNEHDDMAVLSILILLAAGAGLFALFFKAIEYFETI
jgi:hypothetical protein